MPAELINPATLAPPVMDLYSHVAVGPTTGRIVTIAGQTGVDASGELVGPGDHAAQAEQAFRNLKLALAAAGARPHHLIKYTIHVVDSTPELITPVFEAMKRVFAEEFPAVPSTWLGVATLALPEWLVEIDGIAVIS